jgi:cellulose synthase/poly-beta-1,6-N-acetylglucosamine synthase-like glycosyltransferase
MAAEAILITVTALLAWTYLIYPAGVILLAMLKRKRRGKPGNIPAEGPRPAVSVVMAVHNEEKVIEAKMSSLLGSDYPSDRIEFLVGSDGSTDGTDPLLLKMSGSDSRIRFFRFTERSGKAAVVNRLVAEASGEILIITDANVIFTPPAVSKLAEAFNDPRAGLCDATVYPLKPGRGGVTEQENMYSRFETALKRAEGDLWGAMPGPYGGCYAIRRNLFPVLPENILVDDLFAGLTVLRQNYRSFSIPSAVVYEDTNPGMKEQFRRRIRIAAGSFQNMFRFGPFPAGRMSAGLAFFCHKIMRWLTPLLLALFFMTTVILSGRSDFYFCLTAFQLIFIILSALDIVLDRHGKKLGFQRYVTQFLLMNAALAAGFVKAVRGIEKGIWEPTKRV